MQNALIRAGLALSLALAATAASATVQDEITAKMRQWAQSGDTVEQRKDVDESSKPPPPSGPSSQTIVCSPSSVDCP
jgi:hypothetical protein